MTLTKPDIWNVAAVRSGYQSACPYVPAKPYSPRPNIHSWLSRPSLVAGALFGATATDLPIQLHSNHNSPEPVDAGIGSEDWDLLFRAVLETLSRSSFEMSAGACPARRLQAIADVVAESVLALDQLRTCAPVALHLRIE